jgi:hypothetical protein
MARALRWKLHGPYPHQEHTASIGVRDYRVRWNACQGAWEAEVSVWDRGASAPYERIGFYRTPVIGMLTCAQHVADTGG